MGKKEAYHDEIELEDFEYDVNNHQFQIYSINDLIEISFQF